MNELFILYQGFNFNKKGQIITKLEFCLLNVLLPICRNPFLSVFIEKWCNWFFFQSKSVQMFVLIIHQLIMAKTGKNKEIAILYLPYHWKSSVLFAFTTSPWLFVITSNAFFFFFFLSLKYVFSWLLKIEVCYCQIDVALAKEYFVNSIFIELTSICW